MVRGWSRSRRPGAATNAPAYPPANRSLTSDTPACATLQGLGAEVEEVSLPSFAFGLPAYYVIALSEASSNLSRYDGVRYGRRAQAEGEWAAGGSCAGAVCVFG